MSYSVKVRHIADSKDGISIEVKINGTYLAHTFPKGQGWLRMSQDGEPYFVKKFVDIYERRHKDEDDEIDASLTTEEERARRNEYVNDVFEVE